MKPSPFSRAASLAGSRAAPVSSNLRAALESLRGLYAGSGRIDEAIGVRRSELVFDEKADGGTPKRSARQAPSEPALVKQESLSAKAAMRTLNGRCLNQ